MESRQPSVPLADREGQRTTQLARALQPPGQAEPGTNHRNVSIHSGQLSPEDYSLVHSRE